MTPLTYQAGVRFPAALLTFALLVSGCDPLDRLISRDGVDPTQEHDASPATTPTGTPATDPLPEQGAIQQSASDAPAAHPPGVATAGKGETNPPAEAEGDAPTKEAQPLPPHPGPWLWVRRSSAGIYEEPTKGREGKFAYVKRGGKVAILEGKLEGKLEDPGCPGGWYRVRTGGVICNQVGTTDPKSPIARFSPRQPDIDAILPYPYARNAHNGTPLYKSLPSRKQMYEYEPYLPEAQKAREELGEAQKQDLEQMRTAGLSVGGAGPEEEPVEQIPLWEREENLHEVTLDDLRKDEDEVLAQRMMKGFYVAIDKTFKWNGRTWYKTTKGLVAPADRFWQTAGPEFHGIELDGERWHLPVGFVVGARKSTSTYKIDDKGRALPSGTVKKFEPVQLQYSYRKIGSTEYYQLESGEWIRDAHTRVTTPGPRPSEVGPHEVWVDIDISEESLVVFRGDTPIYATLISSGKESREKEKDHSTPRGMWRVREKHMVSTMDGNGSAAGDLPYSIEDVPYIMYFHKSYATHGAFWHQNFGFQMSHGCVNLAPLDAKWLFFHAAPEVPEGMHGAWSSQLRPGSMIVIHD